MTVSVNLPPGYRLKAFDTLDSTNEEAKRQALAGADPGLVVWAKSQSAGRGRRGRTWVSPAGGLYFSLLLKPDCPPARAAQLSFVSALAVAEGVAPDLPRDRGIAFKWPNDLLVNGRKISGILLESGGGSARVAWLVVGIGINVDSHPEGTEYPATSLFGEGAKGVRHGELLGRVVAAFHGWLGIWEREGFEPVREAWLGAARGLGEPISVRLPDRTLDGIFRGLAAEGALILDVLGEGERIIPAGDVYFPAEE